MDLAELQIKADSSQLQGANKELDSLVDKSARAERSSRSMGSAQRDSARDQVASINQINEQLEYLRQQRDKANRTESIESYNREIEDLTRKKEGLEQQGKKVETTTTKMNKAFKVGAGIIAAYFSIQTVRQIVNMAREAGEFADQIDKINERTGLGTDYIQEFRFAGEQLGVEFSALERTIESFTGQISQIEGGTGQSSDAFQKLGVNLRDSNGEIKDMSQLFPEVIEALRAMENETERNSLATQLMSERSADLIPLLNAEQEEIDRLTGRFRELGLAMDENAIRKGVEYNDRLNEMGAQTEALRNEFGLLMIDLNNDYKILPWIQTAIQNVRFWNSEIVRMRDPLSEVEDDIASSERANRGYAESYSEIRRQIEEKLKSGQLSIDQEEELRRALDVNAQGHEERMMQLLAEQAQMTQTHLAFQQQIDSLKESGEWEKMSNAERQRANDILEGQQKMIQSTREQLKVLTEATQSASTSNDELTASVERVRVAFERPIPSIFDPVEADRVRKVRQEFQEFISVFDDIGDVDYDFSHRFFPPGSIGAIQEEISELERKLQSAFDPDEIDNYQKRINALKNEMNDLTGETESTSQAARDLGFTFSSAAEEAIVNWTSFSDLLSGIFDDILRITTRILLTEKLGSAVESGVESLFPGTSSATTSTASMQAASMSMGGANGGQNSVTINNYSGAEMDVDERPNANGGMDIEVTLRKAMKGMFNSGQMDSEMSRNFGVQRRGRNRG